MSWPARTRVTMAILVIAGSSATAQETATVRGSLFDSATRQPVAGAIVSLRIGDRVVSDRSDEVGGFRLERVPAGPAVAQVKRIGYLLKELTLTVSRDTMLRIAMAPAPRTLKPVNVFGTGEGVYGVIGRSSDLTPITGARVLVVGSGITATTDSSGEFFVPLKHPGDYLVRVTGDGFGEEVLPVAVKKNQVVESSQLLDASDRKPLSAGLWDDFDQRRRWKPVTSALVSGAELRAAGAMPSDALMASPAMVKSALRLDPEGVCLFVNGQPRPGLMLDDFRVEDIRAIEVYSDQAKDSVYIGSLVHQWPKKVPCGSGFGASASTPGRRPLGMASHRGSSSVAIAKWVVVWLR